MQNYTALASALPPEQYEKLLAQANVLLFCKDGDSLLFSGPWNQLFGHFPLHAEDVHPDDRALLCSCKEAILRDKSCCVELRLRRKDGNFVWYRLLCSAEDGLSGSLSDISREKIMQQQVDHDSLTSLLNQRAGRRYAEELLRKHSACTLILLDLDDFKQVNDRQGHLFGDEMLCLSAQAICRSFPQNATISRMGGDEFMVLLPFAADPDSMSQCFLQLRKELSLLPFPLSCSAGAALSPRNGDSYDCLFRCADHALYRVKNNGKNQLLFAD